MPFALSYALTLVEVTQEVPFHTLKLVRTHCVPFHLQSLNDLDRTITDTPKVLRGATALERLIVPVGIEENALVADTFLVGTISITGVPEVVDTGVIALLPETAPKLVTPIPGCPTMLLFTFVFEVTLIPLVAVTTIAKLIDGVKLP